MAACSASMATAHICMLLYNMTYLGTKHWHESTQQFQASHLSSLLIMKPLYRLPALENQPGRHVALNNASTMSVGHQGSTHQLHWIPCDSQLADILTKAQVSSKIDIHIDKVLCFLPDHMLQSSNNSTEIWFKKGVRCSVLLYVSLHISQSLITVARMHSTSQPCSSSQCNTALPETKLTCRFKTCSSHPMRLNTGFQMRLNALYTDNYVVVQNNDSAILQFTAPSFLHSSHNC
jgi:hypothetical protein